MSPEDQMKKDDVDHLIDQAADNLAREIDREVLWSMLKELGWTRVNLPSAIDRKYSVEIVAWIRNNIHNPYEKYRSDFIFENEKDATTFILRWL